jgi:hypothetical protein
MHFLICLIFISHKSKGTVIGVSKVILFYLQLFVGGLMSYLRYLCLFAQSGIHPICKYVHCFEQNDNREKNIGCIYTSFAVDILCNEFHQLNDWTYAHGVVKT